MAFGFFRAEDLTPEEIQRRRTYAQQLMGGQQGRTGLTGGMANAVDNVMGAYLTRQANEAQGIESPMQRIIDALTGGGGKMGADATATYTPAAGMAAMKKAGGRF